MTTPNRKWHQLAFGQKEKKKTAATSIEWSKLTLHCFDILTFFGSKNDCTNLVCGKHFCFFCRFWLFIHFEVGKSDRWKSSAIQTRLRVIYAVNQIWRLQDNLMVFYFHHLFAVHRQRCTAHYESNWRPLPSIYSRSGLFYFECEKCRFLRHIVV